MIEVWFHLEYNEERIFGCFKSLSGEIMLPNEHKGMSVVFPVFTYVFATVIVVIFVLDTFLLVPVGTPRFTAKHILHGDKTGYLTGALKLSETKIKKGQLWRLITSTLLHVGLFHILLNTVAFLIVGAAIEMSIGSLKTLLCFIISSLFSALIMAFCFHLDDGEGASTGIYGLIAVYIMASIKSGTVFFSTIPWYLLIVLGIYFVTGLFIDKITLKEHVTGFIGGIFSGVIFLWLL